MSIAHFLLSIFFSSQMFGFEKIKRGLPGKRTGQWIRITRLQHLLSGQICFNLLPAKRLSGPQAAQHGPNCRR
jgi:hypothetical protein